jgi:hypothetical protein
MKKGKNIIILTLGILTVSLTIAFYNGIFEKINVHEQQGGGFTVVGLEFKGSYAKAGKHISEVEEKLKKYETSSTLSFGIYYDDPKITRPEDCRSFVGIILEKKDFKKTQILLNAGFKIDSVPLRKSLQSEFPIKNSFSYMIGSWKVYPKMNNYMKERNYNADLMMEVYDSGKRKIVFLIQYH